MQGTDVRKIYDQARARIHTSREVHLLCDLDRLSERKLDSFTKAQVVSVLREIQDRRHLKLANGYSLDTLLPNGTLIPHKIMRLVLLTGQVKLIGKMKNGYWSPNDELSRRTSVI